MEGFKSFGNTAVDAGLGIMKDALPNASFPLGAIHEFISAKTEDAAATTGFIAGLSASIMGNNGTSLWISASRTLFPPALITFGIQPDRFIFIDVRKEKDVVWAMDEALKCGKLATVIGEMQEMTFTASRRLQLAVEQSQVTGFILRRNPRALNATACVSRWKITTLQSETFENLPGVGYPKWRAELLRIRNGKPGIWDIKWMDGRFVPAHDISDITSENLRYSTSHDASLAEVGMHKQVG